MNRAVKYGTAILLVRLVVNIIHGALTTNCMWGLDRAVMLFVIGVILASSLIAMVLLWASQKGA